MGSPEGLQPHRVQVLFKPPSFLHSSWTPSCLRSTDELVSMQCPCTVESGCKIRRLLHTLSFCVCVHTRTYVCVCSRVLVCTIVPPTVRVSSPPVCRLQSTDALRGGT